MSEKIWFITGAARGLGRIWAEAALERGDKVAATARDVISLGGLVERFGDRVLPLALDVTNAQQVADAVGRAHEHFGRLDVVLNNAGYALVGAIEEAKTEEVKAEFETNFFGALSVTQAVLPILRAQGSGHIVQISSVGGRLVRPGLAAYQSAKWAVGGFSSVLAAEVAPLGIKVTVLEPGGMRTDWAGSSMRIDDIRPEYHQSVGRAAAMHDPDQLAANDTDKVARVVVDLIKEADPPLRLLIGPEAYAYATAAARAQLSQDERWRELSESTVADDATPEQIDPLGRLGR